MMIFGPLVAPRISTVTAALSSPEAVTFSPSTTMTTGSVSVSPTPATLGSVLSISMTSPTATFCCLLPLRTIAYTATHSLRRCEPGSVQNLDPAGRGKTGARKHTEGQLYAEGPCRVKTSEPQPDLLTQCEVFSVIVQHTDAPAPRLSRFDKDHPHYRW